MRKILSLLCVLFAISQLTLSAQYFDLEEGIVAYYPFNGSAEDKTGNGNDGLVKGAVLTQDRFGNPNAAYKFDGRQHSIRIPNSEILDFTQQATYTISLWIKPRDINSGCIILKNYDFGIKWGGMRNHSTIYSGIKSSYMNTNNDSWDDDEWYNLVIVQERNKISYYINGRLDFSENRGHETMQKQDDIFLGYHPYFWGAFEGVIDDICIFSRPLEQLEVEAMYQIERMPLEVTPVNSYANIPRELIGGTWQGIFTQPGNENFDSFAYWMNLELSGDRIKGHSRIEIPNSEAFGIMSINGNLSKTAISISEQGLIRESNSSALDWCLKFTKLRYDPSSRSLRGNWYADNCRHDGELVLFKTEVAFNYFDNKPVNEASIGEIRAILASNKVAPKSNKRTVVNKKLEIEAIMFKLGSANIALSSQKYLKEKIIPFIFQAESLELKVTGHTDNLGDNIMNLQLSIARARAVVDFFINNGIEPKRLSFEGLGESKPIADNNTVEGRSLNRRVEIVIVGE